MWMAVEPDAEHIPDLALIPVSRFQRLVIEGRDDEFAVRGILTLMSSFLS